MKNCDVLCAATDFYTHLKKGNWAKNVKTTVKLKSVGGQMIPITINDTDWGNSYVVSPYAIIPYLKDEMKRNCFPILRHVFVPILTVCKWILKVCRINQVVMVNNHPLSTNLYPSLNEKELSKLHKELLNEYPHHALIFRSLNPYFEERVMEGLKKLQYKFITNRSIYIYSGKNLRAKHRHKQKKDRALFSQKGIEIVLHEELKEKDAPRLKELYDLLYLEKYSENNPQYTEGFFRETIRDKTFNLTAIRYQGVLVGIMGYYARRGIMTPPLVGYDTSLPQSLGLYRMVTALMLQEAEKKQYLLHMSSGAASFKRNRGCFQEIESMGVYVSHLPLYRRLPWVFFGFLFNKIGKPLLIKRQL